VLVGTFSHSNNIRTLSTAEKPTVETLTDMSKDSQLCLSAHHRVLKCFVLLVILKFGDSLKLTPVQNQSRKLELDQETKSISAAFSEAKELISNEPSVISESHAKDLLQSHVMKKLHSSIERWNSIEDRLRSVILTTDQVQTKTGSQNTLSQLTEKTFLTNHTDHHRSKLVCLTKP
jgi:hypothetical protein